MNEKNVIYGRNVVSEALCGNRRIKKVFFSNSVPKGAFSGMISGLTSAHVPFAFRNDLSLKQLCGSDAHQGVVAVVSQAKYASLDEILKKAESRKENPFILVLDGIQDPQNLGSMIRSADCAGVHGVVIAEHGAVGITPAVVRVAAGATEHMTVAVSEKISHVIEELRKKGIKVVGTDTQAKAKYYNIPMREPVAIVIGSEGEGIKKSTADACDILVSIPMGGKLNSLNAAVSAAVLMFEVVRQRTK